MIDADHRDEAGEAARNGRFLGLYATQSPEHDRQGSPVLELSNVSKRFGETQVLCDITLAVSRGQTMAVVGPSGSGKTTLLRCVNFLVPYDSGRIYVNGKLIGYKEVDGRLVRDSEHNVNEIRKQIGIVFQQFNLFPHRTVVGNLLEGPVHVLRIPREEAERRAAAALKVVGLSEKSSAYPDRLSGGQQQRVAIARALCMQPEIMLFDEVTSALDPELVEEVLSVMRKLANGGMTMVVVTHEMKFARDVADCVVFMDNGRIVANQPTAEFFEKPLTPRMEAFLRRAF